MILIGMYFGEYEGNRYAKLIFTEPFERANSYGTNAVISKANYFYCKETILPEWDLYANQKVRVNYDRFGKVSDISVI